MHVDFEKLEAVLKTVAYAKRLELLAQLRFPKTMDEIRLGPGPARSAGRPDRPISRQALQRHLDQLVEAGFVRVRRSRQEGTRAQLEFVLEPSRIFGAAEEFRAVSRLGMGLEFDPARTVPLPGGAEPAWDEGPKVVLTHGVDEGRAFALQMKDVSPPRGWVIGRGPDAHVRLDYDPYVSTENAEIVRGGDGFRLLDLRSAKNGTYLNWRRLAVGSEVPLRSGDVIGVGRSLLLFRDA